MPIKKAIKKKDGRTAQQKVYEVLKDRIINGVLSGGQQLRQDDLASEFGVSRIPVREALIQLDSEGLVRFSPYKGAVVTTLSPLEVWDIFDIRFMLESTALNSAVDNLTEDDFHRIYEIVEAQEKSMSPMERSNLNWDFHSYIYEKAHRPKLYEMITSLHVSVDRYLRLYLRFGDSQVDSMASHQELVDALKSKDIDRAIETLRVHLKIAQEQIMRMLSHD